MFRSFTDMHTELVRLRAAGDQGAAARALVEQHLDSFPLHVGFTYQMLAQLQAEAGERERALDTLAQALSKGARYRTEWLPGGPRLSAPPAQPRLPPPGRQASAPHHQAPRAP